MLEYDDSLWGDEKTLKLIMVMVAQSVDILKWYLIDLYFRNDLWCWESFQMHTDRLYILFGEALS